MLLVTGGAGFYRIECRRRAETRRAAATSCVCDLLGSEGKWRNLAKRQLVDILPLGRTVRLAEGRKLDAVIHLGAISETTAPTAIS